MIKEVPPEVPLAISVTENLSEDATVPIPPPEEPEGGKRSDAIRGQGGLPSN